MNVILNNPFRILGLPVTASERDIVRRVSELTISAEMGKIITYQTDFPFLSDIQRTPDTIQEAARAIERDDSRRFFSLFWFRKNTPEDEAGFALLQSGEPEKCLRLWGQASNIKYQTSIIINLSVLYLALAGVPRVPHAEREEYLSKGVRLSGNLFSSPFFDDDYRELSGTAYKPDKERLIMAFADEVFQFALSFMEKSHGNLLSAGIRERELSAQFDAFPEPVPSYITERLISQPIQRIEKRIEDVREKRSRSPHDALRYGEELSRDTRNDLAYLTNVLSLSALQYQITADKLANELLQCAIDYFNKSAKLSDNPGYVKKALNLVNRATSLAVGQRIRNRTEENLLMMTAYIKQMPGRKQRLTPVSDQRKKIQLLITDIADRLKELPDPLSSPEYDNFLIMAQEMFDYAITKLLLIREYTGADDPEYLNLSSAVSERILAICVVYADKTGTYTHPRALIEQFSALDMNPRIRERYQKEVKRLNSGKERNTPDITGDRSELSDKETEPQPWGIRHLKVKGYIFVISAIAAYFCLGEYFSLTDYAGSLLILAGVLFIVGRNKK